MSNEKTTSELTVMGERGVELANLSEAMAFAKVVYQSGMSLAKSPEMILVQLQTGMELGLTPMRSLQSVVVVKGRATLMGETALALIRSANLLETGTDIELGCRKVGEGDDAIEGHCRSRRRGGQWQETVFTLADAKKAGLYPATKWDDKSNKFVPSFDAPWNKYTKRMLMWRAVSFHVRDYWSDVTHGLRLTDEAHDMLPHGDQGDRRREKSVPPPEPSEATLTGPTRDPLLGGAEVINAEWDDDGQGSLV